MKLSIGQFVFWCWRKTNRESDYKAFFARRRKKGLCRQCAEPVTKYNPYNGKLYAKCEEHRLKENENSWKRRNNFTHLITNL